MSKVATKMITTYNDGTPVQENPYSERNAKLKVRAANTYKNIKKIEAVNDEGEVVDVIYVSSAAASEVAAVGQLNEQLSAKDAEIEALKAQLAAVNTHAPTPTPAPTPTHEPDQTPEPANAPEPVSSGKGKGK